MALYKWSVRVAWAGSEVAVSSIAPSSPTEWKLWYDTTNDVLKAYDGTNWNVCWWSTYIAWDWIDITNDEISVDNTIARTSDINTKTFYISGTSDLTNAQAVYDWLEDGKNPLIIYNNYVYRFAWDAWWYIQFFSDNIIDTASTYTQIDRSMIRLDYLNGAITRIRIQNSLIWKFLSTTTDYYEAYTPLYAWSPATKKYVDDSISGISWWIQNDTVWTTSRIDSARLWDSAEYTAVTKAEWKVYLVYE